ncbi:MAG: hypothetical protein DRP00_06390 [Candidatus Aenigmatarchaeota archaeon]|nr:MAG: hypothetical protein DRP00_06390 [Candidatus Aenigmarchaeota archaeon]
MSKFKSERMESAKLNVQVSSILIAVIAIAFQLSDELLTFPLVCKLFLISAVILGVILLLLAIIFEADAVFYLSVNKVQLAESFDKIGYSLMKLGLFFSFIVLNYLTIPWTLLTEIKLPYFEIIQILLPLVIAIVPFSMWRKFKSKRMKENTKRT